MRAAGRRFAERRDGGFGVGFEEESAQVEIGFENFGVEIDSTLVFGAGFGRAFEVGVGKG